MATKQTIKLNEKQLKKIIAESTKKILSECNEKQLIKEDFADYLEYIGDILKMGYQLRHKIHKFYDYYLDGETPDGYNGKTPVGNNDPFLNAISNAYSNVNSAIQGLKSAVKACDDDFADVF